MNTTKNRVLGTLLGVAIGDALGATHEFECMEWAQYATGDIVGGGPFHWRPGQPTDDTDQTLIVAEMVALSKNPEWVALQVQNGLIRWLERGPRDVGNTTREALTARKNGRKPRTGRSRANGSLMRTAPIGFIQDHTVRALTAEYVSRITHPNTACVSDCVDYSNYVHFLITEHEIPITNGDDPRWWYDGGGHVTDSYDIALWALTRSIDVGPEDALVDVVRLGGDADTNAAIAGGLLGAAHGADAWPSRWIDRIETAGRIFDLTEDIMKTHWEGK